MRGPGHLERQRGHDARRCSAGITAILAAAALIATGLASHGQNAATVRAARAAQARALAMQRAAQRAAARAMHQQHRAGNGLRPGHPAAAGVDPQARQLMALFLRQGTHHQFVGEQVTRLLQPGGRVRETQQTVRFGGPGRFRMDYTAPPQLRGEMILVTGGRFYHYRPKENTILDGVTPPGEFETRARQLLEGIRSGTVQVHALGEEHIAGHPAGIVEIRSVGGGSFYLKFWIDQQTGVRLKHANLNPQGSAVSETYFTSINYEPSLAAADFSPAILPNVRHEPLLPEGPPLASVKDAQSQVGYTVKEPAAPEGFRLNGVWVVPGPGDRRTTILRYTDGVNTFALFETPRPPRMAQQPASPVRASRNGVAHWISGSMAYTVIGNLRQQNVQMIADSLR